MAANDFNYAALDPFAQAVRSAALEALTAWGKDLQRAMREQAPWNDRGGLHSLTGQSARESLEAEATDATDDGSVELVARSTRQSDRPWREWDGAPVGQFLELGTRSMAPRAVIWPVLSAMAPAFFRDRLPAALGEGWEHTSA